MRRFVICTDNEILFGCSNQKGRGGGGCGSMGEGETMQELVWKPEVNRSLGRRWCKWKGKYKIDLQAIVLE
jgi:hypothetical protein